MRLNQLLMAGLLCFTLCPLSLADQGAAGTINLYSVAWDQTWDYMYVTVDWPAQKQTSPVLAGAGAQLVVADGTSGWSNREADVVAVTSTYSCDFNLDGSIDASDLRIWYVNAGMDGSNVTWQMGDANCDGYIDLADFDLWLEQSFQTWPVDGSLHLAGAAGSRAAVPEPGTLGLLAVGLIGLLGYVAYALLAYAKRQQK
jgi:hypothetical protein